MFNRNQLLKLSNNKNQNVEVLSVPYNSNISFSYHNLNEKSKNFINSSNYTDNLSNENNQKIDNKKSKSLSNIVERANIDKSIYFLNVENIKPSLKLSVESVVNGQKLQMNCELLLLSSSTELWPLSLHHLNKVNRDFHKFSDCHEELLNYINVMKTEIIHFENVIFGEEYETISTDVKITYISDLVTTAITIMELTYQIVYTISATQSSWKKSQSGILDRKTIISAIDEVELSCFRLREVLLRTSNNKDYDISNQELQDIMLFSCTNFSSALTYLAICCRTAAANVDISLKSLNRMSLKNSDTRPDENLFQLAMRSVSKSSQCLLASVKNYVHDPTPENRFITESFTNSVSSSVKALAAMATSGKFVGYPSLLPASIKMTRNTICGSCLSVISPIIQLLQTTSAIYFVDNNLSFPDPIRSKNHQSLSHLSKRTIVCLSSIRDALSHLHQTLNLYENF